MDQQCLYLTIYPSASVYLPLYLRDGQSTQIYSLHHQGAVFSNSILPKHIESMFRPVVLFSRVVCTQHETFVLSQLQCMPVLQALILKMRDIHVWRVFLMAPSFKVMSM